VRASVPPLSRSRRCTTGGSACWQREVLVDDVARLWDDGMRHLTFGDPDFLNAVPHALAVVRARCTHAAGAHLRYHHQGGSTSMSTPRSSPSCVTSGLLFIVSAVGLPPVPACSGLLDKGHSAADVLTALGICRALGLSSVHPCCPSLPWSTLRDQLDLLDMIAGNDLIDSVDPVQLSIRRPGASGLTAAGAAGDARASARLRPRRFQPSLAASPT